MSPVFIGDEAGCDVGISVDSSVPFKVSTFSPDPEPA